MNIYQHNGRGGGKNTFDSQTCWKKFVSHIILYNIQTQMETCNTVDDNMLDSQCKQVWHLNIVTLCLIP